MADRLAIVNASPLIFLAGSGYIDFLQLLERVVMVPEAVALEIQQYGADDPTARVLQSTSWLRVEPAIPIPSEITSWDLGPGESSVLAMAALHSDSIAILDDRAARRCAAAFQITVAGTLGLVLMAKNRGTIPAARPVVDQLRQAGMFLSDAVVNSALVLVGE